MSGRLEDLPPAELNALGRALDGQLKKGPGAFGEAALNGMPLEFAGLLVALQIRRNQAHIAALNSPHDPPEGTFDPDTGAVSVNRMIAMSNAQSDPMKGH